MKGNLSILLVLMSMSIALNWDRGYPKLTASLPVSAATDRCTVIGRIISVEGDRSVAAGRLLCEGDRPQPATGSIAVLCYTNWQILNVSSSQTSGTNEGCPSVLAAEIRCNPKDRKDCGRKPRGPNEDFQVISPRNTSILNERPKISWSAVPGATSYSVSVTGLGVKWQTPQPVTET